MNRERFCWNALSAYADTDKSSQRERSGFAMKRTNDEVSALVPLVGQKRYGVREDAVENFQEKTADSLRNPLFYYQIVEKAIYSQRRFHTSIQIRRIWNERIFECEITEMTERAHFDREDEALRSNKQSVVHFGYTPSCPNTYCSVMAKASRMK